jgi:hypothetical protein
LMLPSLCSNLQSNASGGGNVQKNLEELDSRHAQAGLGGGQP